MTAQRDRFDRMWKRGTASFALLLTLGCGGGGRDAITGEGDGGDVPAAAVQKPYLLLAGDLTPANVAGNIDHLESLPFDGGLIVPVNSWVIANGNAHRGFDALWDEIGDLKFRQWQRNFLMIFIGDPPDFFEDWDEVIDYWRDYARVARRMRTFAGIVFDNEEYAGPVWTYPEAVKDRQISLDRYIDQVRLRGRQVMEAVQQEYPGITVLHYHGPYVSDPETPHEVSLYQTEPSRNNLMGAFFMGMLEARRGDALVIDGGEVYQYRSRQDFETSYQWRKYGMAAAAHGSPVIPPEMRATYPQEVSVSFGLYNLNWTEWVDGVGYTMTPAIMRDVVEFSLSRADHMVWLYTEEFDWAGGAVPQEWIDAIREGRAAAWRE